MHETFQAYSVGRVSPRRSVFCNAVTSRSTLADVASANTRAYEKSNGSVGMLTAPLQME